jgi:hypothetical protein
MQFFTYLTTSSPQLGTLGWVFFIVQIIGVAAGAYLVFLHSERNPARATFARQLGTALMIFGVVGVVLGVLRMLNVPYLNQHVWFWIQAVIELIIAGYVIYYVRNVLPALEKQSAGRRPTRAVANPRGLRNVSASTIETAPSTPRPVATTSRRDARRDRKRRKG